VWVVPDNGPLADADGGKGAAVDRTADVRIVSDESGEPGLIAVVRLSLSDKLAEDEVWQEHFDVHLKWLPDNIQRICGYGFTEILNNAIDHSGGSTVLCWANIEANAVVLAIADDGIGIFEKLKLHFALDDHRHAILELSKGKLTTDKARHTGEGIFFTSRMFDDFFILANHLGFSHSADGDWLIEVKPKEDPGTHVSMSIDIGSKRTTKEVFDMFADPSSDDLTFSKTHVPVVLARHGSNELISRSEAKRVLSRFEGFKEVLLDFAGIEWIGPAFADEIFRVFHLANPEIRIAYVRASESVKQMIDRAIAGAACPPNRGEL
jgi:hypothetical protein